MSSTAPHWLSWGLPTPRNTSEVRSLDWQTIDAHIAYLAAVRHFQQPVAIGRPLGDVWCADALGGQVRFSLRAPAATRHFRTAILASFTGPTEYAVTAPPSAGVQFRCRTIGGPWSALNHLAPVGGPLVLGLPAMVYLQDADWVASSDMAMADSPVVYGNQPISLGPLLGPLWAMAEQEIEVEIQTPTPLGGGIDIWAFWVQDECGDGSQLTA